MSHNGNDTEDLLAKAAEKALELHRIFDAHGDQALVELMHQLLFDIAVRLAKREQSRGPSTPPA